MKYRPLTRQFDREKYITLAIKDPSSFARRIAVSAVIKYIKDEELAKELAEPCLKDKSRPVRDRAEFLFRQFEPA